MNFDASHLFVRVDACASMGTGHFMRCLSLGQYWRDEQGEVTFIGQYPIALAQRLEREGISSRSISAPHPDRTDAEKTTALIPPRVPIVIDGYHFDSSYHRRLATDERRILVIDDSGHLPTYGGHVILNQNINADRVVYDQAPATRLLGTRYALLGRSFRRWRGNSSRGTPKLAQNLLVTLGGADLNNDMLQLLRTLAANVSSISNVRVVAGAANTHLADLHEFCDAHGDRFELHVDTTKMADLMSWADLAVTASGTTAWELAYMGVPSVYIAIATNQVAIGEGLASHGAGVYIGPSDNANWSRLAAAVTALARDPQRRVEMTKAATTLVDGEGVMRVAAELGFNQQGHC